jgi:large subunit ribosomal protein L10
MHGKEVNTMPTAAKAAIIDELADQLGRAKLTIIADYRGLKVSDLQGLRRTLTPVGAEVRVAKNTLTTLAATKAGIDGMEALLEGPTALVLAYQDPVQASKIISDFVRTSRVLTVRGGVLDSRVVSAPEVDTIATLPSREELLAKLLGMLASPMARAAGVLSGPVRSLPYLLNARADQLGGEQAA